jgi:hypothetical protein
MSRTDYSKISFEDILNGTDNTPLPGPKAKESTVVIPDKPDDAAALPGDVKDKDPLIDPNDLDNTGGDDNTDAEESLYEGLSKILGYEIDGEFDESVEGVAAYTKAVGERIAQEELQDLFESIPDVKEYLQFRLNGGDPQKYFESKYGDVDFSKYSVDEKDETTQEVVVRKYLGLQGYSEDEINETVKDYKDTGLLFKSAKAAANRLTESQRSRREQIIADQAERARAQEVEREQTIAQITSVIDKGSLQDIIIPEKDRKDFRAWLLQPDAKGVTRRQVDMQKLTIEQKLQLEYLAFKGFNLNDLVKKEATKTRLEFLKKQTTPKTSRLGGTGSKVKAPQAGKLDFKLNDVL